MKEGFQILILFTCCLKPLQKLRRNRSVCRAHLIHLPTRRGKNISFGESVQSCDLDWLHSIDEKTTIWLLPVWLCSFIFLCEFAVPSMFWHKPNLIDPERKQLVEIKNPCVILVQWTMRRDHWSQSKKAERRVIGVKRRLIG